MNSYSLPPGPQGLEALPVAFLVFSLTPRCEKPTGLMALGCRNWSSLALGTGLALPEAELPLGDRGWAPQGQVPSCGGRARCWQALRCSPSQCRPGKGCLAGAKVAPDTVT